jgi:ribosomal protein S1
LIPGEVEKLIVGQCYDGFVTGTSVHGIFVEFNGCLTGLISKSDMSEEVTELFSNGRIKPGDTINFFLKEILEDNRLVLSINPVEPSPWETIEDRKITKFGVFIELEPKIVGLLHRSYLDEADVFEVGQTADAVVVKIDVPGKKVYLAS